MPRVAPPPWPRAVFNVGVTGHRDNHATFVAARPDIDRVVRAIFDRIEACAADVASLVTVEEAGLGFRILSMLADGSDTLCAEAALARDWGLIAPLPFGPALTAALGEGAGFDRKAVERVLAAADAVFAGAPNAAESSLTRIAAFESRGRVFTLAEKDAFFRARWLEACDAVGDKAETMRRVFEDLCAQRYALASRIIINNADLMLAIWDGESRARMGGTGDTMRVALDAGVPVLWIDPAHPERWRLFESADEFRARRHDAFTEEPDGTLEAVVRGVLSPVAGAPEQAGESAALLSFRSETWKPTSNALWRGYRVIEWALGARRDDAGAPLPRTPLAAKPMRPDKFADAYWKEFLEDARAHVNDDSRFIARLHDRLAPRFAWADGIATVLSDAYRGGMVLMFVLAWLAVIVGVISFPLEGVVPDWVFAAVELVIIGAILLIINIGNRRRRWHTRWLEIRRVAEYLRHAHVLSLAGIARPVGRWPRAVGGAWPEWYARQTWREIGVPSATVTTGYLRWLLTGPAREHVRGQRLYHHQKCLRLRGVDRALERISTLTFLIALVLTVATTAAQLAFGDRIAFDVNSVQLFGVIIPMLAATIASLRFFGDFDRFAEISAVTRTRLADLERRLDDVAALPDEALDYEFAASLLAAIEDAVVSELESWQAVFGGKQMAMPS